MTGSGKTKKLNSIAGKNVSLRHADHADELVRLKKIKGQVEGLENMISSGRYCADILVQIKAVTSALKSVELSIFERHIRHCLLNAFESGSKKETDLKIDEILMLIDRRGH